MIRILVFLGCTCFLSLTCLAQIQEDPCEAIIPLGLSDALKKEYPTYRIVRVTDYLTKTISIERNGYPNYPCLAVASADVDGDGYLDYAFFVVDPSGQTLLMAGRNLGGKNWQVSVLRDFDKNKVINLYLKTAKSGKYTDFFADSSEYEAEPGRAERYTSTRQGFIAGMIESSGVVFFFSEEHWIHLWLWD
jgi:hypothetical protein